MFSGERGRQGDIGHDGPRGHQGDSGPDDLEHLVTRVTAEALAANRLKLWDARLLLIYAFICLGLFGVFLVGDAQFHEFCETTNEGNTRVNALLDELQEAAARNPNRTPAERAEAVEQYQRLHLPVPACD